MTRQKKAGAAVERQRLLAEIARLEADATALGERLAPEYQAERREMERLNAEAVAAGKEMLRHGVASRARSLAETLYRDAVARRDEAVKRLVAIGNASFRPWADATERWASYGRSHRQAEIVRAKHARERKPKKAPIAPYVKQWIEQRARQRDDEGRRYAARRIWDELREEFITNAEEWTYHQDAAPTLKDVEHIVEKVRGKKRSVRTKR